MLDIGTTNSLHQLFEYQAKQTPNKRALLDLDGHSITYQQFNAYGNIVARYLRYKGLKAGDVVGIHIPKSIRLFGFTLGILKAGGIVVGIESDTPTNYIQEIIDTTQMKFFITTTTSQINTQIIRPHTILEKAFRLVTTSYPIQNPKYFLQKFVRTIFNRNLNLDITRDDPAAIVYTSGSTGKRKAVVTPHRATINRIHSIINTMSPDKRKMFVSMGPIATIGHLRELAYAGTGVPNLVVPPSKVLNPKHCIDVLREYPISLVLFTPSLLKSVLETNIDEHDWSDLHYINLAGEIAHTKTAKQVLDRFPQMEISNWYGMSESPASLMYQINPEITVEDSRIPVGKPCSNVRAYILDEHLKIVPPRTTGELYLGGDNLALGYLEDGKIVNDHYIDDPILNDGEKVFATGDLGEYAEDGNINILGRVDDIVKIRGLRVNLKEVDTLLEMHTAINQAITITENTNENNILVSYITLDKYLTLQELKTFLRQKVPTYKIPSKFYIIDTMPILTTGKIDKQALPLSEKDLLTDRVIDNLTMFDTRLEFELKIIWNDLFGAETIITSNSRFFDLGADSLMVGKLMLMLDEKYGYEPPLSILIENPTIPELSTAIQSNVQSTYHSTIVDLYIHNQPPDFTFLMIPPSGSTIFAIQSLFKILKHQGNVYGVHPLGSDKNTQAQQSIEEMAKRYWSDLESKDIEGELVLFGHCHGGFVALEMGIQYLQKHGVPLRIMMLDTPPPLSGPTWQAPWKNNPDQKDNLDFLSKIFKRNHDLGSLKQRSKWISQFIAHHYAHKTYVGKPYKGAGFLIYSQEFNDLSNGRWERRWDEIFIGEYSVQMIPNSKHLSVSKEILAKHPQSVTTSIRDFLNAN